MILMFYFIVCISFNLLYGLIPSFSYDYPYWACGGDWQCVCPFISLCNLKIFPGSSPIGDLPMILFISASGCVYFFHSPISTPYPYNWGYMLFYCDATHRPHSLHICFMPSLSHYITLSFYASYIVDCMYTHVIPSLVLKVTKTTKELIQVLLFILLRMSD